MENGQSYLQNSGESQKLPIQSILQAALRAPFQNIQSVVRLCWPYILLSLAFSLLFNGEVNGFISFLVIPFFIVTGLLAAVSCHRLFLEAPEDVKDLSTFRWSSRESRYFLNCVKMFLAAFVLVLVFGAFTLLYSLTTSSEVTNDVVLAPEIGDVVGLFIFGYLFARICLMLPSAAVGKYYNLSSSWSATRPYAIRLFIAVAFIPGIIAIMGSFLYSSLPIDMQTNFVVQFAVNLVALLGGLIELCILSKSYEWIQSQEPKTESLEESVSN